MKQAVSLILLVSSLLYVEVASDYSFLQIKDLNTSMTNLLKVYDTINRNPALDASQTIQNFFVKINNFTNDLAKKNIDLRFNTESISFSSYWKIPRQIDGDLNEILIAAKSINEYFEAYYIDLLDGFHTNKLIEYFITVCTYSLTGSLYDNVLKMNNIFLSRQPLNTNEIDIFDKISDNLNRNLNQLCEDHSTRQQFLIALYSFIMKTQFRAFLMTTSAYKLKFIFSKDPSANYSMYVNQCMAYSLSTWNYYLGKMKSAVAKTSTDYYNCKKSYEYNKEINDIYVVDLSPTIIDYKWNKVVTGIQFEFINGFLRLILYDGILLKNGKISNNNYGFSKHFSKTSRSMSYSFPKDRKFDYKFLNAEYVHESYWNNLSFLFTKVPEEHAIVGANFEVLKFDSNTAMSKKIIYLRLHCAKINTKTNKIDTSNITYTKVWTKDDPELQQHPEIAVNYSFRKKTPASYEKIRVTNINNSSITERWRRRPSINSYIDSKVVEVYPHLPINGIGLWKNKYMKNSNYLSLKISTMDISSRIKYAATKNN